MPRDNERISESLDYQESDEREQNQQLGARVLSQVHFESSHQPIVDSSFNKAIKKGEKLPGKNSERRNLSYLNRLNKLIEKHGNKAEHKLWKASINDNLLVQYGNIPESYWNAKKQELRDNGYGNYELTEEYKREIYEKERELQKGSLEKWVNYLGDEHSPYPLWFKVYAWDGMTKMGRYNKRKGKYETRNETTVAPYPYPDAEILAGVFDVINRYYGNNEKEFYTEEGERNIKLEQIVQSGSFPKIFNAIQQDIAPIVEPPENPEDVHGEWAEYELGDEDDIARAARGTGWCVSSPSVGRHYLEYGTYGDDDDEDDFDDYDEYDDEYDEYDKRNETDDRTRQNHSKFILFHLIDEKTGKLSKNACASIRLDPDGAVAEISGLRDGQALDDSLVPIVEEKVKSLPGGEKFLPKFADKNMLIALDHKMQNGEDLTKEELEFLYEIHRPIQILDTYNNYDPRVEELRQKYGIAYALDAGININNLVSKLSDRCIAANLDALISHGANINIDQLVSKLDLDYIAANLDALISHGANINIDQLVSKLDLDYIAANLDTLLSHEANHDNLLNRLNIDAIFSNIHILLKNGFTEEELLGRGKITAKQISDNIDYLINAGFDIELIASKMTPGYIVKNIDTLKNAGAKIDINSLVQRMIKGDLAVKCKKVLENGADVDLVVSNMTPYGIIENYDILKEYGAKIDIEQVVGQMEYSSIALPRRIENILECGMDATKLASMLEPHDIAASLDILIKYGAKINIRRLVHRLDDQTKLAYISVLNHYNAGINENRLKRKMQLSIDNKHPSHTTFI